MFDSSFILRFVLVGGGTALLFLGLLYGLVEGMGIDTILASTIACLVAIAYNYTLHYHWTFVSTAPHSKVLMRYGVMCVGAVVLNAAIMHFGLSLTSLHFMLLQVVAGGAITLWNFSVSFFWVFQGD